MDEQLKPQGEQPLPTNLNPAVVKAKISLDLTRKHGNYMQVVNQISTLEVTDENFESSQELIKKITSYLGDVEDHRTAEGKPYLETKRVIDAEHKAFAAPLEAAKQSLQAKLNIVGRRKEEEAKKAKEEQQRVEALKSTINNFILDNSLKIAAATTNEQLLSIERLINLEKANKAKYQDHLPLLIERSNELTSKLKEQKDLLKKTEKLEADAQKALDAGEDEKAQELLSQKEVLSLKIEENTILVQETAAKSITVTEVVAPEVDMPNTRRKSWKFEITDMKEAIKKAPNLLDVSLNFKKTTEVLKTLKETGVLNGKSEYMLNGIRYYEEKNF